MVTPLVEARVAEAAFWLHLALKRDSGWLRRREREQAVRKYLAEVVKAHLIGMLDEPFFPAEAEAEERLSAAIEHAVREANCPEVAAAAARYDAELARIWRAGYMAEVARRWAEWTRMPIHSCMTPEADAYDELARAELEELARRREAERHQEAGPRAPAEGGLDEEVERRLRLLAEYTRATGATEHAIYSAAGRHHSCHKPEFYKWKRGELPAESETARSLERFLAAKQPPGAPKGEKSTR